MKTSSSQGDTVRCHPELIEWIWPVIELREIIMWLPKSERYLLIAYYTCMPELRVEGETFSENELRCFVTNNLKIPFVALRRVMKLARELRDKRKNNSETAENQQQNYPEFLEAKMTIWATNRILNERGFLEAIECGTGYYNIKMKLEGLDLSRKYSSWWTYSGLWFREYKDHWIWLIASFFGGVIGALLINWLSR